MWFRNWIMQWNNVRFLPGTATYGGICISGASGILPVGMVMCTLAGEHNKATFSELFITVQGWERLARWATMLIQCLAFGSIKCGAQFYKSGRQAFEWILHSSGTGEPVCFTEYGGFCISGNLIVHKRVNAFGTKQRVRSIVNGRFQGCL